MKAQAKDANSAIKLQATTGIPASVKGGQQSKALGTANGKFGGVPNKMSISLQRIDNQSEEGSLIAKLP
jgi:hypothetical protein